MVLISNTSNSLRSEPHKEQQEIKTRCIIYANDFDVSLLFIIFQGGLHQVVKYAYHQISNLCYRKTKAITALISTFVFVLHLCEGTDRICERIESF